MWESHNKTRILEFSYMNVDTGCACMYLHTTHTYRETELIMTRRMSNRSIRNALNGYKCRQSIENTYTIFAFILSAQLIRPNQMRWFKHMWTNILEHACTYTHVSDTHKYIARSKWNGKRTNNMYSVRSLLSTNLWG